MTLHFLCPQGHPLTAAPSQVGMEATCPTCGVLLIVPDTDDGDSAETTPPEPPRPSEPQPSPTGKTPIFFFYCPAGHKLNGPLSLQGRPGKCPHCGSRFVIPTIDASGEEIPPSPTRELSPAGNSRSSVPPPAPSAHATEASGPAPPTPNSQASKTRPSGPHATPATAPPEVPTDDPGNGLGGEDDAADQDTVGSDDGIVMDATALPAPRPLLSPFAPAAPSTPPPTPAISPSAPTSPAPLKSPTVPAAAAPGTTPSPASPAAEGDAPFAFATPEFPIDGNVDQEVDAIATTEWQEFFRWVWRHHSPEQPVEILLKEGERIRPALFSEELSREEFAVFAVDDGEGAYTMMAVRWDDMQRIVIRHVSRLPPSFR